MKAYENSEEARAYFHFGAQNICLFHDQDFLKLSSSSSWFYLRLKIGRTLATVGEKNQRKERIGGRKENECSKSRLNGKRNR
ncbi:hypothetical protein Pfo_001025 [Paulownia fortunei]|nr:hypothetical protein Pfo_001025 [Paulownia fortunei]